MAKVAYGRIVASKQNVFFSNKERTQMPATVFSCLYLYSNTVVHVTQ